LAFAREPKSEISFELAEVLTKFTKFGLNNHQEQTLDAAPTLPLSPRKSAMPSPLVQQLDRDVLQIVARYLDSDAASGIAGDTSIAIYQYIQNSNSSLRRKPKSVLSSSIERAIAVIEKDRIGVEPVNAVDPVNGDEPRKKRRRTPKPVVPLPTINTTEADMGGVSEVFLQLDKKIGMPLRCPEYYTGPYALKSHGILLYGPSGCGKTTIARIFAARAGYPCIEVLSSTLVSNMSGDSEANIRSRFEEAKNLAPSLLLIDQIDIIAANRETSQAQMDKRMVSQLLACMDDLRDQNTGKPVMVLATTSRPDNLDPSLRGGGRFGIEINIGVPDIAARAAILRACLRNVPCKDDLDVARLAKMTAGYVGSDLQDLVEEAFSWHRDQLFEALIAQQNESDQMVDASGDDVLDKHMAFWKGARDAIKPKPGFETMTLSMEAFLQALPKIVPSAKRQGFASVPETTWEDIGALDDVREELQMSIVNQILHPDDYAAVGIDEPTGALLYGPPGCGKTMLAKAVANECQATFINVKGSELLNKVRPTIPTTVY
jgi:ribosome biogenesis ATPase